MVIPEPVKNAALFPEGDLPEPPPEHPYRQVRRDGYMVGLFPGQTVGTVTVRSLDAGAVEQTVQEVRRVLAKDGKSRGAWMVADAASPDGLAERLQECGHGCPVRGGTVRTAFRGDGAGVTAGGW